MEVKQPSLIEFLRAPNTEFVIPVYQRNYAWQETHCRRLLSDIRQCARTGKSHFLGTITYIAHIKDSFTRESEFVIIDGQQRITSIMLLLKAIEKYTTDDGVRQTIFSCLNLGEENKLRLKPIIKDAKALQCVMAGHHNEFNGYSKLIKNYEFFLKEILTMHEKGQNLKELCDAFNKLNIVIIGLEKDKGDDDPQAVFESINATGLHLEGVDLIRNFLMMNENSKEQKRLFETYWKKIDDSLIEEKHIDDFIKKYLRIYYGSKLNEEQIYETFKEMAKNKFNNDKEAVMQDLVKFARIYKFVVIDTDDSKSLIDPYDNLREKTAIFDKVKFIRRLNFRVAFPFIMRLADDFQEQRLDFENFYGILNVLISYFVRRKICAKATNALNEVAYDLYEQIINKFNKITLEAVRKNLGGRTNRQIFPSNETLKTHFDIVDAYGLKSVCLLILYEIEALSNKDLSSIIPPDMSDKRLTVEHFYPQTGTKAWRDLVGDFATLEQQLVNTFGNLTLINKSTNSRMQNKTFDDKIAFFDESALHLNNYFKININTWDVAEIQKRSEYLYNKFIQVEAFKDLPESYRTRMEIITLESDWKNLKPSHITMPNGENKAVKYAREIPQILIDYLLKHHKDEFMDFIAKAHLDFIKEPNEMKAINERKERVDLVVDYENYGFYFTTQYQFANNIRENLVKLVHGVNLDPNSFEIKGYYGKD